MSLFTMNACSTIQIANKPSLYGKLLANITISSLFRPQKWLEFQIWEFLRILSMPCIYCTIFVNWMLNIPEERSLFIRGALGTSILPSVSPTGHWQFEDFERSTSLTLVFARAMVKASRARPNRRLDDPDSRIVESDSSV